MPSYPNLVEETVLDTVKSQFESERGHQPLEGYLTGDVSLVLKTSGARDGQGIDTANPPPIL